MTIHYLSILFSCETIISRGELTEQEVVKHW